MTPDQMQRTEARKLLAELDGMAAGKTPGPKKLADWNMRAQTLLVFGACRRIAEGGQLCPR
jgi:hypothetical protein